MRSLAWRLGHLRAVVLGLGLVGAAGGLAGCGDSTNKAILGSYDIMVSRNGLSDPDVVTVAKGSNRYILDFAAGIQPADGAPTPLGIAAQIDGTKITVDPQPAHVTHSTGEANGKLSATGTLPTNGSSIQLTITFLPSDGPDAGQTVMYDVSGNRL